MEDILVVCQLSTFHDLEFLFKNHQLCQVPYQIQSWGKLESNSKDNTFLIFTIRLARFAFGELSKVQILNISGQTFTKMPWFTCLDSSLHFPYGIYLKREQIIMNKRDNKSPTILDEQKRTYELGGLNSKWIGYY